MHVHCVHCIVTVFGTFSITALYPPPRFHIRGKYTQCSAQDTFRNTRPEPDNHKSRLLVTLFAITQIHFRQQKRFYIAG